jgi:protein subunit release factor A
MELANNSTESGMAKILEFKRVKREAEKLEEIEVETDDVARYIDTVMNNYSLTVSNRHWILENMLMDIDDRLEEYRKELEKAEQKLETLVKSAEAQITEAYTEFTAQVGGMTRAVRKLTGLPARQDFLKNTAGAATANTDQQTGL